jgi:hypothetical protein
VRTEAADRIDWRDPGAYAPLLEADRSILAWEWLRRDPAYRGAAGRAREGAGARDGPGGSGPDRWGLHLFEPPSVGAPDARPVWRADVFPSVLEAEAEPCPEGPDSFDLARLAGLARIVTGGHAQHLLLSDGLRALRIDVDRGGLGRGPVRLHYRLGGIAGAEQPLRTLRHFLILARTGRFGSLSRPCRNKAKSHLLALRAWDGLAAGASQREIAAILLSPEAREPRWRIGVPTLRSRVQRLVHNARTMAAGGYEALLGS